MTTDTERCTEWRALASCRLDGELDEFQAVRLDYHLRGCVACRTWADEIAALAELFHESELVLPVRTLELRAYALRRRLVRAVTVGATAASAAAVAAFAVTGSGISPLSAAGARVTAAPCASCTKKQALTLTLALRAPAPVPAAAAPVHVVNPFVVPE